jgi:3-methyladenine DNA glycosylase/8-oxoguanine DNA glycosylase
LRRVLKAQTGLDLEKFRPWRAYAAIYLWKEFA